MLQAGWNEDFRPLTLWNGRQISLRAAFRSALAKMGQDHLRGQFTFVAASYLVVDLQCTWAVCLASWNAHHTDRMGVYDLPSFRQALGEEILA